MAVKEVICNDPKEREKYKEALVAITVDESLKRWVITHKNSFTLITTFQLNGIVFPYHVKHFSSAFASGLEDTISGEESPSC